MKLGSVSALGDVGVVDEVGDTLLEILHGTVVDAHLVGGRLVQDVRRLENKTVRGSDSELCDGLHVEVALARRAVPRGAISTGNAIELAFGIRGGKGYNGGVSGGTMHTPLTQNHNVGAKDVVFQRRLWFV